MTTFIVYEGRDEIIVTTPEDEAEMIRIYFTEGGRKGDDYDRREVVDIAVSIFPRIYCR